MDLERQAKLLKIENRIRVFKQRGELERLRLIHALEREKRRLENSND